MKLINYIFAVLITFSVAVAKEQVQVVGSSTVYPFITVVAENFARKKAFQAPIVESTGTGGGFNMFCSGVGAKFPDMNNASRAMKDTERDLCKSNGVNGVFEVKIGYDAIVIIKPLSMMHLNLSTEDIFLALAKSVPDSKGNLIANPYKKWSDINPMLPNLAIQVMGPPSTSGTRDSFIELAFEVGCKSLIKSGKLKTNDASRVCKTIRSDGPWINGGENDSLLLQKVSSSKNTLAVIGFSFYQQNQKRVSAVDINRVAPSSENLSKGTYSLYRPLFVYFKMENYKNYPSLQAFIDELTSPASMGERGYLSKRGLLPLSKAEYSNLKAQLKELKGL